MENKEIGKLFKEKLEYLNHAPNDLQWENIKKDLDKRKKTRLLIWIYTLLFIGFLPISYIIFNSNISEKKEIIVLPKIENNKLNAVSKSEQIAKKSFKNTKSTEIVSGTDVPPSKTINLVNEQNDSLRTKSSKASSETKIAFKKTKKLIKSTQEYDIYEVTNKYEYRVKKKKTDIVTSRLSSKKANSISNLKMQKSSFKTQKLKSKNQKLIAKNRIKNNKLKKDLKFNQYLSNRKKLKMAEKSQKMNENSLKMDENKLNISENLFEIDDNLLKIPKNLINDSIKKTVPKKPIKKSSKVLKPKDSIDTVFLEPEDKKIEIYLTPFIGLNYYSVFKSNNLSQQYNENSKTGKLASTYGIYLRAMFNKKAGVRFGLGISNLHYSISIDKTNQSILDYSKISLSQVNTDSNLKNIFINDDKIQLTQKMSSIEMPIEFYYVWKDKKFGFATATGFSIFLENQNLLTLSSNSVSEFEIGGLRESNSYLNFTANLATYFTYKFNDRINFEMSPQFRYQLFGVADSQGLNPIIFYFQTGFSYKLN